MKKVLTMFTILIFSFIAFLPMNVSAKSVNKDNDQKKILNELKSSNIPEMKSMAKDLEKNGKLIGSKQVYVKIFNNSEQAKHVKTEFTPAEYSQEVRNELLNQSSNTSNINSFSTSTPYDYGWVKLTYEIYDTPYVQPAGQYAIMTEFEWEKIPTFQGSDVFAVGHDSNSVFYNDRTRFVYYPDAANPQYSHFYDGIGANYINQAYSYTYASGIYFKLLDNAISDSAYNVNPDTWKISLKGKPKGIMTCFATRANSTSLATNLSMLYGHQQIVVDFKPSLSVGSSGSLSLGGISGTLGYDYKSPVFAYNFGDSVFKPE